MRIFISLLVLLILVAVVVHGEGKETPSLTNPWANFFYQVILSLAPPGVIVGLSKKWVVGSLERFRQNYVEDQKVNERRFFRLTKAIAEINVKLDMQEERNRQEFETIREEFADQSLVISMESRISTIESRLMQK